MRVKGTAYHARINLLRGKWGSDRVDTFLRDFEKNHPGFPKAVLPTTWLPAEDFLALIDEPMSATEIVKLAYEELQIPRRRAFEMLAELKRDGSLKQPKKRGPYEPT